MCYNNRWLHLSRSLQQRFDPYLQTVGPLLFPNRTTRDQVVGCRRRKAFHQFLTMAEISQVLGIVGSVASMITTANLIIRYSVRSRDTISQISTLYKIFEQCLCSIKEEVLLMEYHPGAEGNATLQDLDQLKREVWKLGDQLAELRNVSKNLGLGKLFPTQSNVRTLLINLRLADSCV